MVSAENLKDLLGGSSAPPEVLLVGIGGGGCQVLSRMTRSWVHGPRLVGIDSDRQALASCDVSETLLIGESFARGQGAGGDVAAGKVVAEESLERIREAASHADVVFLIATLGGGTGTGAAPVVADVAKQMGALVISLVSLPFSFEGEVRQKQARLGLRDLRLHSDAVVVMPNDRLLEDENKAETLVQGFDRSDLMVGVGVRTLWRLFREPGVINVGFSAIRRLLEQTDGTCSFGYGVGSGPTRVEQALQQLLTSVLMDRGAYLAKCGGMLVNLLAPEDLRLAEVQQVMTQLKGVVREGCDIVMGVAVEPAMGDQLHVTILAAEEWMAPDEEGVPAADEAPVEGEPPKTRGRRRTSRRSRETPRVEQSSLDLDGNTKGRFKGVEPTLYRGQDLDVPTFIRKGIKILSDK